MKTVEAIKEKIKAMKKRGYQSYEFGNFLESENCFAFAEALKWVLDEEQE